jgi:hypothetical protein
MSTEKVYALTVSLSKDVETGDFADDVLAEQEAEFLKIVRNFASEKATTILKVVSCVLVG